MKVTLNGIDRTQSYDPEELESMSISRRAWQGETGQGVVPVIDPSGSFQPYAGQQLKVEDPPAILLDGYVGGVRTVRGTRLYPGRVHYCDIIDRNRLLKGFRTAPGGWSRPTESDEVRMRAFAATFAPGLSLTWALLNNAPITTGAKVYRTDDLLNELLADVNRYRRKIAYVSGGSGGTDEFHYHYPWQGELSLYTIWDAAAETQTAPASATAYEEVALRNGTYRNGPTLGIAGPFIGLRAGATFNGTSQWVEVPDSSSFDATTALSIEAWVNWTTTNAIRTIIRRGAGANEWWLREAGAGTNGELEFGLQTAGLTQIRSAGNWNDGLWHHVVGTYDGANMRLFVDGTLRAGPTAKTGSIALATDGRIGIGAYPTGPAEFWSGSLAAPAVYVGTPLFTADVTDHYERGRNLRFGTSYRDAVTAFASARGLWMLGERYQRHPIEPERTKDPDDLRNDIRGFNKDGSVYTYSDATSIARHNAAGLKHQAYLDAGDVSLRLLSYFTSRALDEGKNERVTYSCDLGPFTAAETTGLREGQRINTTMQLADLTSYTTRIAQITWKPYAPGLWMASLELEYPKRRPK